MNTKKFMRWGVFLLSLAVLPGKAASQCMPAGESQAISNDLLVRYFCQSKVVGERPTAACKGAIADLRNGLQSRTESGQTTEQWLRLHAYMGALKLSGVELTPESFSTGLADAGIEAAAIALEACGHTLCQAGVAVTDPVGFMMTKTIDALERFAVHQLHFPPVPGRLVIDALLEIAFSVPNTQCEFPVAPMEDGAYSCAGPFKTNEYSVDLLRFLEKDARARRPYLANERPYNCSALRELRHNLIDKVDFEGQGASQGVDYSLQGASCGAGSQLTVLVNPPQGPNILVNVYPRPGNVPRVVLAQSGTEIRTPEWIPDFAGFIVELNRCCTSPGASDARCLAETRFIH